MGAPKKPPKYLHVQILGSGAQVGRTELAGHQEMSTRPILHSLRAMSPEPESFFDVVFLSVCPISDGFYSLQIGTQCLYFDNVSVSRKPSFFRIFQRFITYSIPKYTQLWLSEPVVDLRR